MAGSRFDWSGVPRLRTANLALRPLSATDAADLLELHSDPAVSRFALDSPATEIGQATRLVAASGAAFAARQSIEWAITCRGTDRLVGVIGLHGLGPHRLGQDAVRRDAVGQDGREAEIRVLLGRAWWGRHIVSEAVREVFSFAFGALGLDAVAADVDPANKRCLHLVERFGLQPDPRRAGWYVLAAVAEHRERPRTSPAPRRRRTATETAVQHP